MGSEHSDPADRGKDINKRGQNIQGDRLSDSAGQDPNIEFVQEEIKKRPLNRKKMMRRMMMTAIMAAVFGAVACLFFLLLEPIFNRMLYPKETVTGVSYPEETETEELTPEEMIVNEEEKAATEEQERIREEVERILQDREQGAEAIRGMVGSLRSTAAQARAFLVDVSAISSDTDWFNDPYETRGTVTGIVIAKTDAEVQVLVYAPEIDSAQSIQVTFADGASVEASIRARDRVSGLAVLSAAIENLDSESKDQIQVAELGTSTQSALAGQLVIAVGRPTGTNGSISYGAVTSASTNLDILDSGLMQITTDIYGSRQASGVLLNTDGLVVGVIDTRHGRQDLPGILCAIGVTEMKPLIEKLSAGGKKSYLGVQCTDVPEDVRERMSIPEGVYLSEVADDSPAMQAGLQKGDVITSMGGEEVHYSTTISRILLEQEAGTEIGVTLMRPSGEGYTEMELTVTLE